MIVSFYVWYRRPPISTRTASLCPSTTLFRSHLFLGAVIAQAAVQSWRNRYPRAIEARRHDAVIDAISAITVVDCSESGRLPRRYRVPMPDALLATTSILATGTSCSGN